METRVSLDRTNKNVENQVERNEDGMFREATVKIVQNPNEQRTYVAICVRCEVTSRNQGFSAYSSDTAASCGPYPIAICHLRPSSGV